VISATLTSQVPYNAIDVNKSLRSVFTQRLFYGVSIFQERIRNCCYISVVHTVLTISGVVKRFNAYTRCNLSPMLFYLDYMYVLGPGSLSLLVLARCPWLILNILNQRQNGNVIDCWQNPTHQAKPLGTSILLERFC